jgi:ubiquinone/menaquinone biosynthesis C-methylase UbiE
MQQNREPEIMDQPGLDPARHRAALRGLARINFLSASASMLWRPLAELAQRLKRPIRVLDVATGGGDVPIRLWQRGRRYGIALELSGCDVSPTALEYAQGRANAAGAEIQFFRLDVLREPLPSDYDAAISSLFLHHLDAPDAIGLLCRMRESGVQLVLVNDLTRSRSGWLLAQVATRLLSRCSVVHTDGPRSVKAAYTPKEALELAEHAGLSGAKVQRRWPCRYLLTWERHG